MIYRPTGTEDVRKILVGNRIALRTEWIKKFLDQDKLLVIVEYLPDGKVMLVPAIAKERE